MSVELSIEQGNVAFDEADKNHDGRCSVMELSQFLAKKYNFPLKDAVKLFSDCDKDDSRSISRDEFLCVLEKARVHSFEAVFDQADTDHSGSVNITEFINFLNKKPNPIRDVYKLKQLFKEADKDKSGQLSKDEFLAIGYKY